MLQINNTATKGVNIKKEIHSILSNRHRFEITKALPNEKDISNLALYFQNFSDCTRLKILSVLSCKSLCVNDISNILNINQTTISHQLKLLKTQNLIYCKRSGKYLVYTLNIKYLDEFMSYAINNLAN